MSDEEASWGCRSGPQARVEGVRAAVHSAREVQGQPWLSFLSLLRSPASLPTEEVALPLWRTNIYKRWPGISVGFHLEKSIIPKANPAT